MRHRKTNRKFSRTKDRRNALLRNLAVSLILYEKISTTKQKAKEVRKLIDKLINLGKKGDFESKKIILKYTSSKNVLKKLTQEFPKKFEKRNSGYTRIITKKNRKGDNAEMVIFELLIPRKINKKEIVKKQDKKIIVKEEEKKSWFDKARNSVSGGKKDKKTKVIVAPRTTSK